METHARYILIGLFVIVASLAGFGFIYWLHATGGLGERTIYRVRFENTVSGLRTGAAVSFNGIRVGEVTNLQLNPGNPGQVFVTIAIDTGTPVRSDTQARIDVQGLMGSPSIALSGGSPNLPAPVASKGEPPLLVADASAGQDLTQTAREVLGRIDKNFSPKIPIRFTTRSRISIRFPRPSRAIRKASTQSSLVSRRHLAARRRRALCPHSI